jgi:hypothetical protein
VLGWWVLYGVGKKTHKNCVSGPFFACSVSPRHAFSGKNRCRQHSQLSRGRAPLSVHMCPTFKNKLAHYLFFIADKLTLRHLFLCSSVPRTVGDSLGFATGFYCYI